MAARRTISRLFYFTIEDEGMLAEAFSNLDSSTFGIAYKVVDTEDVFVCTAETKEGLDKLDVPYNLLAQEDASRVSVFHSPLSKEELADYDNPVKALALAYRAIAMACVGTNGESDLGFDLSDGTSKYTYFTAPAGHTFIFRLFTERGEARTFLDKLTIGDKAAMEWVESIPLQSRDELVSYH